MSPGTTRIRKKMITATRNRVGIITSKRLIMYLVTERRPLLGQPHAVELVVDEMAGRDGPAAELGAVRDDAVPLERVGVVRLLVQQSPLEVADVFPPLLGVEGAALLLVEIVQGLVDVAAVVVAADPHRLELVQVQVGIDRVAALGVDRSEEHTSELQSPYDLVCRLLLEKKKEKYNTNTVLASLPQRTT